MLCRSSDEHEFLRTGVGHELPSKTRTTVPRLPPIVLLVHCPPSAEIDIEAALGGEGIGVVHSSWDEATGLATRTSAHLAIVWPSRHDFQPRLPEEAMATLLRAMSVLVMLRSDDGQLLESIEASGAWALHEGSSVKTVMLVAKRLLLRPMMPTRHLPR